MNKKRLGTITMTLIVVSLVVVTVMAAPLSPGKTSFQGSEDGSHEQTTAAITMDAVALTISYQARITDPITGQVKPDGNYSVTFSLYDADNSGTVLWTETKTVSVNNGVFSTNLGDMTVLDNSVFNGQALWLGLQVESDAEATPRQRITVAPYAASLVPGAQISGDHKQILTVDNANTNSSAFAVYAEITSTTPGPNSAAIRGDNRGTGVEGTGIIGSHSGNGNGVYGRSFGSGKGVFGSSGIGEGVYGFSNSGIGVYADSNTGTSLYVNGDAEVTGQIVNNMVPIAHGYINADGSKATGSSNVTSTWSAVGSYYEITISGENYYFDQYVTNVTLISNCPYQNSVRTSSANPLLLVNIYNSSGSKVQCDFQFVTYKP